MKTIIPTLSDYDTIASANTLTIAFRTHSVNPRAKTALVIGFSSWVLLAGYLASLVITAMRESSYSWSAAMYAAIIPFGTLVGFGALLFGNLAFRQTFQETITIERESIQVEYKSLLFKKRSYEYLAKHIQDLRVSPSPSSTFWSGRILFDYGGETNSFGSRLTASDAKKLLSIIKTTFDGYDFAD